MLTEKEEVAGQIEMFNTTRKNQTQDIPRKFSFLSIWFTRRLSCHVLCNLLFVLGNLNENSKKGPRRIFVHKFGLFTSFAWKMTIADTLIVLPEESFQLEKNESFGIRLTRREDDSLLKFRIFPFNQILQ